MTTSFTFAVEEATGTKNAESSCCGPSCCSDSRPVDTHQVAAPSSAASIVPIAAKAAAPSQAEALVATVREHYAEIAKSGATCCGGGGCSVAPDPEDVARGLGYSPADLAALPADANLGLGCGAPLTHLAPQPGETVLDLGSGPGLDVLLAARAVGPEGRVIGVDMTPAMLSRARANAAAAGVHHVEFREGRLEQLPVVDSSVDAVTSNCVINLVPDKTTVFREIARVLRPGGRMVISDIVLDGTLPASVMTAVEAYVGCIAGASRRQDYLDMLASAGLGEVAVLREIDYAATLMEVAPTEIEGLLANTGLRPADVLGIVKSVTIRACKPS